VNGSCRPGSRPVRAADAPSPFSQLKAPLLRRFYCLRLPLPGETIRLGPAESHHLLDVLRLPRQSRVRLFDGAGREVEAALVGVDGNMALLEGREGPAVASPPTSARRLVLGVALLKAPALDNVLRMATELGVTEIWPLLTARSVPRPTGTERWQRVLAAATRQCGRVDVPRILPAASLKECLGQDLPQARLVLVPGAALSFAPPGDLVLLVGPEGGFSEAEVEMATSRGFLRAGLGPHTLRADTAAVAALACYGLSTGRSG
jgi:16S rRNA (uracil1498-N3)-methyltransferase